VEGKVTAVEKIVERENRRKVERRDSHEPMASAVEERRPIAKVATAVTLVKRWTIVILYVRNVRGDDGRK
jgi:hypothetical protein